MSEGYVFGNYEATDRIPSTEEIEKAKERVVEKLCEEIRKLSKEYPEEFFIIHDAADFPFPIGNTVMTIGAKLIAPTIKNKE